MASWGNTNYANNAPTYALYGIPGGSSVTGFKHSGVASNAHANTLWGVPPAKVANSASKAIHAPGWVSAFKGTGPVTGFAITAGGSGYANTDTIRVSGGTTNATATLTTNATGGIVTVTPTAFGAGFIAVANSTLAVVNSTAGVSAGTGATITFTLGGRSGRVFAETLVVMKSLGANGGGSEFTNLP